MEAVRNPRNRGPPSGRCSCATAQSPPEQLEQALAEQRRPARTSASARSSSTKGSSTPSGDLARPRRAARARVRRARPPVDRHLGRPAAAREPGPPLPGDADPLPRRRLRPRRGRRSDQRHVLRRAAARGRDAGPHLRRLAGDDRARDHDAQRPASVPSRGVRQRRAGDARTRRAFSTCTTTRPPSCSSTRAISKALDLGASDIHFTPQQRRLYVRVRVDGVMRELTSIPGTQATAVVEPAQDHGRARHRRAPRAPGRPRVRSGAATSRSTSGWRSCRRRTARRSRSASCRRERHPIRSTRSACAPRSRAALERAISQPFGAVVVVGPTGSGKTTTLFTCLQILNTPDRQLTTIEDPVEYRVDGLDQVEVNPRAGLTFASGLRTMLRSDPDVLLVGEIRDEETAQIAFRAAMTGHLDPDDAARPDSGIGDPAADRHEHRAQHPRHIDQLHHRPAARPARLPGVLRGRRRRTRASAGPARAGHARRAGHLQARSAATSAAARATAAAFRCSR